MKCPRCTFVASHKKDICPRCEFDLRAKKRELGFPVHQPDKLLEHLITEHRAQAGQKSKQYSSDLPVPEKTSVPFWKKLFGAKQAVPSRVTPPIVTATTNQAPTAATTATPFQAQQTDAKQLPPPPVKVSPAVKVPIANIKLPTPVLEDEISEPLLSRLDALEHEMNFPAGSVSNEGLEFQLKGDALPVPDVMQLSSATSSSAKTNELSGALLAENAGIEPGTEDDDFQDLLRALEEMGTEPGEDDVSQNLFGQHVPEIDSGLDDIIHALDDVGATSDIDDIELFQTKLNDLASSLQSGVDDAKSATALLGEVSLESSQQFPSGEFESLTEEPASVVSGVVASESTTFSDTGSNSVDPTLDDFDIIANSADTTELDAESAKTEDFVEPGSGEQTLPTSSTPIVSPEVIELDDNDEDFHKTLDALIGDDVLNVEAVKVAKKTNQPAQNPAPALVTDDGMEISFEFDLEGSGAEVAASEESAPQADEHDPILAELLSTYEVLEQNIEHRSIAPEGVSFSDADDAPQEEESKSLPHAILAEGGHRKPAPSSNRAEALLQKLSFLSDDLLGELKSLLLKAPAGEGNDLNQMTLSSEQTYGTLDFEVAEKIQNIVRDSKSGFSEDELSRLQAELGEELDALQSEGLTIYSEQTPACPEGTPPLETRDTQSLAELPSEFEQESEALEAESIFVHECEASAETASTEELENLSAELEEEIQALEAEGFSVHESEAASEAAPNEDLQNLSAELEQQIEALEAEGFSVHESETATEIAPTEDLENLSAELEQQIEALEAEGFSVHESEAASKAAPAEDLQNLSAELEEEIQALEAEGFSVHESETASEAAPAEDLQNLSAELEEEIQALEAEGFSVHESETASETAPSEDLQNLSAELEEEIQALEAEGFSVHESETASEAAPSEELENLSAELEDQIEALEAEGFSIHESEAASEAAPSEDLQNLSAELEDQIEALEAEGFSVHESDAASEAAPSEDLQNLSAELEEEIEALDSDSFQDHQEPADETLEAHFPISDSAAFEFDHDLEAFPPEQNESNPNSEDLSLSSNATFEEAQSELRSTLAMLGNSATIIGDEFSTADEQVFIPSSDGFVVDRPETNDLGLQRKSSLDEGSDTHLSEDSELDELFPSASGEELSKPSSDDLNLSRLESPPHEQIEETQIEKPEEISRTGKFLAEDLIRLVDLVAEEKPEQTPQAPEAPTSTDAEIEDTGTELDLADFSRFFTISDDRHPTAEPEVESSNEPLEGALSTGVFLASDLERIIAAGPGGVVSEKPKVIIANGLWDSALTELSDLEKGSEVELGVTQLATFQRSDGLDVLFDLAEEELRDPAGQRHRVTSIPTSQKTDLENKSLRQALSTFEREEHVMSKRRARSAKVVLAEERVSVRLVPAGLTRRIFAGLVDSLMVGLVGLLVMWLAVLPERIKLELIEHGPSLSYALFPYLFQLLGLGCGLWLVGATVFVSGWGQSFGAQLLGIEVVDANGNVPTLQQSLLRALSTVTALLPLGMGFLPVLSKSRRAVHDRMSNTYVRLKAK